MQDDPAIQQERAQLLANVKEKGFSDGYQGIRVTAKGRRFRIEGVTLWTVSTGKAAGMEGEQGRVLGQAAVFTELTWLDDGETPECGTRPLPVTFSSLGRRSRHCLSPHHLRLGQITAEGCV